MPPVNTAYRDQDLQLWRSYKASRLPTARDALLKRFDGVLQSQVNKWAGAIPREALLNEARLLALKAFDSYDPAKGTALSTHVVNGLQPISRMVYSYQNTARLPENLALKVSTYTTAVEELKNRHGRDPTTDELHNELGWPTAEITRLRDYNRRDLVESGPAVDGDFFSDHADDDDVVLGGIYFELLPEEKRLFEYVTGYNGAPKLGNREIMDRLGWNQAQLSYRKTLLTRKIDTIMNRPGHGG